MVCMSGWPCCPWCSVADRLQKWLAAAGVGSRRAVEPLIRDGRVKVNGTVVTNPAHPVAAKDEVILDGQPVEPEPHRVYMLHKPAGIISAASDTHGRRTVTELVPGAERVYPVGRLDADTTGLILLSNDGALANRLTHPRYEVEKTYLATVRGYVTDIAAKRLAAGVELDDGPTAPAAVRVVKRTSERSVLRITIREGRNRQVRRMGDAIGHPVESLQRVRMGSLRLGSLEPGEYRRLSDAEVSALRRHAGLGR